MSDLHKQIAYLNSLIQILLDKQHAGLGVKWCAPNATVTGPFYMVKAFGGDAVIEAANTTVTVGEPIPSDYTVTDDDTFYLPFGNIKVTNGSTGSLVCYLAPPLNAANKGLN